MSERTPARQLAKAKWKRELWRLLLLVPGLLAIALVLLARQNPETCEQVFSRGFYPWASSGIAFLSGFVSISVAQWFVVVVAIAIVAMIAYYIARIVTRPSMRLHNIYRMFLSLLGVASFALFFFTLLCGLNYYRLTFAQNEGFEVEESSVTELTDLCNDLVDEVNESRSDITEDMSAYIKERGGFEGYAVRSVKEMEALASTYSTLERPFYSQPKPVTLFSGLMSQGDITGMFFAYTVESNINIEPPFYTIPATMLHELAHQCGYMREDDANFIAYLACSQSGDPLVRYSGYSMAYSYAISALAQVDESAARLVATRLSDEVRADRIENAEFWSEHDGPIRELAQQANDAYLKVNDQSDGTRSYGRMVDLLLAQRRSAK